MIGNAQLLTKLRASSRGYGKNSEVQSEGHYLELFRATHSKLFPDLESLLLADHYQPIRNQSRQQPFDREKDSRAARSVITVKDMTVISVYKLALPWSADQRSGRQPTI